MRRMLKVKIIATLIGLTIALSILAAVGFITFNATSKSGIDCSELETWSSSSPQVNLHHVFCGKINRQGKDVGYHANPNGKRPSTYLDHGLSRPVNSAGIYEWDDISLKIDNLASTKSTSTMFPDKCSRSQVVKSIVYSANHSTKNCTNPDWAKCGLSAPAVGNRHTYCLGNDGSIFIIATSLIDGKINTAFPIYTR